MGDENTILDENGVRHVLRRTGFGAPPKELAKVLRKAGKTPTRGSVADVLLNFKARAFRPRGDYLYRAHNKWVAKMQKPKSALQSKLAVFWHGYFATQSSVVGELRFLSTQIGLLHEYARGNFKDFVKAINRDPAMMLMLDTPRNKKHALNENYARELQEIFTLGVKDLHGQPNYTQSDVVNIARCFTGWTYDWKRGTPEFDDWQHDYEADFPDRGPKLLFQSTGGFGSAGRNPAEQGEGEDEIDHVTDILFEHTDSQGHNTVARQLTQRLMSFFCHDAFEAPGAAEIAVIDEVIATSGFVGAWDLTRLLRALFTHDCFFETSSAAPYGTTTRKAVKSPIDFFLTTLRLTGVKLRTADARVFGGSYDSAYGHLSQMGQVLMEPPSVFGWDGGTSWLSSSALMARFRFARDLTASREGGGFRPEKLVDFGLSDPEEILDAVLDVLGIPDQVTEAERQIYIGYLTDDGASPVLDLHEDDTKVRGLTCLIIQSPAFQHH